jgi:hypothetical protein
MRPDPTERPLTGVPITTSDEVTIVTMYMVVSDIDGAMHGPFATLEDALAFAELADGSVVECAMREV